MSHQRHDIGWQKATGRPRRKKPGAKALQDAPGFYARQLVLRGLATSAILGPMRPRHERGDENDV